MLGLKDINEVIKYNYNVCEIYDCDEVATNFYEKETRNIDLCLIHYMEIQRTAYY
jgi:hypothetical protein